MQCAYILLLTADDASIRPSASSILTGDDGLFDLDWEGILSPTDNSIESTAKLRQQVLTQSARITYLESLVEKQNLLIEEKDKEIDRLKAICQSSSQLTDTTKLSSTTTSPSPIQTTIPNSTTPAPDHLYPSTLLQTIIPPASASSSLDGTKPTHTVKSPGKAIVVKAHIAAISESESGSGSTSESESE